MTWPLSAARQPSFLGLLACADAGFILLHLLNASRVAAGDPRFSLEEDRGFAEVFQYVKLFWIAVLLGALAYVTRHPAYVPWSLLFAYLMLDDAMQIHERLGERLAGRLDVGPAIGLRPQDFGEWAVSAAVLAGFLLLLGGAHWRASRRPETVSTPLFALLLALAVAGVAFDALHVALRPLAHTVLVLAEDGGEMLVVSVACWYAFATWEQARSSVVHDMAAPAAVRVVRSAVARSRGTATS